VGEFCHDNSADQADRSPAGTCEWNLLNKPANHGWPFCVGDNSAFNTMTRWNYAANASTGQKYDCSLEQIPSDIRWAPEGQTAAPPTFDGLDMIPKPVPATIWRKYPTPGNQGLNNPLDFGDLSAGGMQPVAGPIYRYNPNTVSSGGFPAYYDGSWLINNRGSQTGFWKEVKLRQDNNEMLRVHDWLPANFAGNGVADLNGFVIGSKFGQDGALYITRYPVGCCRNQTNANTRVQIAKITFEVYDESTAPETSIALDPATPGAGRTYPGPVTVNFTSRDVAGAGQVVSGVDYVEHRVNINGAPGEWVRTSNTGTANPFTHSATISAHGNYVVEFRSVDRGGNASEARSVAFTVFAPTTVTSEVRATVMGTLGLTVSPITLGAFMPGVANQYTGTGTANVTSSWPNASLTVHDATGTNVGRMTNGSAVLASPLQASDAAGTFANLTATPRALKTWAAPVSGENTTLTFRQSIAANEALAHGVYSKAVTFTLTTTTP